MRSNSNRFYSHRPFAELKRCLEDLKSADVATRTLLEKWDLINSVKLTTGDSMRVLSGITRGRSRMDTSYMIFDMDDGNLTSILTILCIYLEHFACDRCRLRRMRCEQYSGNNYACKSCIKDSVKCITSTPQSMESRRKKEVLSGSSNRDSNPVVSGPRSN